MSNEVGSKLVIVGGAIAAFSVVAGLCGLVGICTSLAP